MTNSYCRKRNKNLSEEAVHKIKVFTHGSVQVSLCCSFQTFVCEGLIHSGCFFSDISSACLAWSFWRLVLHDSPQSLGEETTVQHYSTSVTDKSKSEQHKTSVGSSTTLRAKERSDLKHHWNRKRMKSVSYRREKSPSKNLEDCSKTMVTVKTTARGRNCKVNEMIEQLGINQVTACLKPNKLSGLCVLYTY